MSITDPVLAAAAGLDPNMAEFSASDIFKAPTFTYDFKSPAFPVLNGPVVMKYPTIGDAVEIERVMRLYGGGPVAEVFATARVLVQRAPSSWYRRESETQPPVLVVDLIPDPDGLRDMVVAFDRWRSSFRSGGAGEGVGRAAG
jgi:hypothetical protein